MLRQIFRDVGVTQIISLVVLSISMTKNNQSYGFQGIYFDWTVKNVRNFPVPGMVYKPERIHL